MNKDSNYIIKSDGNVILPKDSSSHIIINTDYECKGKALVITITMSHRFEKVVKDFLHKVGFSSYIWDFETIYLPFEEQNLGF